MGQLSRSAWDLRIKRVYEPALASDGFRILVDRLWPRGLTKERAQLHLWLKELAPSTELRRWFAHDPTKWSEFQRRYQQELRDKSELLAQITQRLEQGPVTLVYGAKDESHNDAVVLRSVLTAQEN